MIAVFAELTVASNTISPPLTSVSLRVINSSTFVSVNWESFIFRTASLNWIIIFVVGATFVDPLSGLNVIEGPLEISVNVVAAHFPVPISTAVSSSPISPAPSPSASVFP